MVVHMMLIIFQSTTKSACYIYLKRYSYCPSIKHRNEPDLALHLPLHSSIHRHTVNIVIHGPLTVTTSSNGAFSWFFVLSFLRLRRAEL